MVHAAPPSSALGRVLHGKAGTQSILLLPSLGRRRGEAGRLHLCPVVNCMRSAATPPVPDGRRDICIAKPLMSVNFHSLKRSRGWRCQITATGIFAVQNSSSRHDAVPSILRAGADASPSEKSGRPITSLPARFASHASPKATSPASLHARVYQHPSQGKQK